MNSPCTFAMLVLCGACGRSHSPLVPQEDGGAADLSVFSDIDVEVHVWEMEHAQDDAAWLAPVEVATLAYVEINDGTWSGRVPGLRIVADGSELEEVESAAGVRSFAHAPEVSRSGQRFAIELHYRGAVHAFEVGPLAGDVTHPAEGEGVAADEPLEVTWSVPAEPSSLVVRSLDLSGAEPAWCGHTFQVSHRDRRGARLEPRVEEGATDARLPCAGELSITWSTVDELPSPLRSLTVYRRLERIHRFELDE